MKKVLFSLCAFYAIIALSSCRSAKEMTPLASLNGEWNIVEINGSAVVPGQGKDFPYIGLDVTTGRVSGNSGCNRMMGSFNTSSKAGEINLGTLAGTRMMCPDMTMEQNVLNALKLVRGYRKADTERIALLNANRRPVVILEPRTVSSMIESLEGEWLITDVNGQAIPTGLEKQPFISFDINTKRIHGNAGCNMINSGMITEDDKPRSLSFPAIAATMMACPNMDLERKILDALNQVKSFDIFVDKSVSLNSEDGRQLLVLKKK